MLRKLFIGIVIVFCSSVCYASPLENLERGKGAVDLNWKVHSFEGGNGKLDITGTFGVLDGWAVQYRQMNYTPLSTHSFETASKEFNIIYQMRPHIQLYTGYSKTTGHDTRLNCELADRSVWQAGVIASYDLSKKTTLYTILGGGDNVANVEFGLSYKLNKNMELTSTYRHFTVEKVGLEQTKENYRGFGMGLTYKW